MHTSRECIETSPKPAYSARELGNSLGGSRVTRSPSIDETAREILPSGAGETVCNVCENATTELHTRLTEESENQNEEHFAALEKIIEEVLS